MALKGNHYEEAFSYTKTKTVLHFVGCLYFPVPSHLLGPQPWPCPGIQFVFTDPGPQFVFTSPGPQFVFTDTSLQYYYQSGFEFCIYRPCLLNLCMYLHTQITRVTDLGPEFAFTLLLVVAVTLLLVVVIVAVVISLE